MNFRLCLSGILSLQLLLNESYFIYGQGNRVRIYGMVRLATEVREQPDFIRINLMRTSGSFVTGQTLMSGQTSFLFENVQKGQYLVQAVCPGFQSEKRWVDAVSAYSNLELSITLTLRKVPDPREEADRVRSSGKTVSVSSLAVSKEAQRELENAAKEDKENNPRRAIEHLEKALEFQPDLYQVYNNLAVQYLKLGDTYRAIESLEKSIELNPNDATIYRNLAELHLSQSAWIEALTALDRAIGIDPEHGKGMMLAGEAYLGLGDCENALNFFKKALDSGPEHRSYLGLGQCYLQLGQNQEAVDEFRGFIESNPEDPRVEAVQNLLSQLEGVDKNE